MSLREYLEKKCDEFAVKAATERSKQNDNVLYMRMFGGNLELISKEDNSSNTQPVYRLVNDVTKVVYEYPNARGEISSVIETSRQRDDLVNLDSGLFKNEEFTSVYKRFFRSLGISPTKPKKKKEDLGYVIEKDIAKTSNLTELTALLGRASELVMNEDRFLNVTSMIINRMNEFNNSMFSLGFRDEDYVGEVYDNCATLIDFYRGVIVSFTRSRVDFYKKNIGKRGVSSEMKKSFVQYSKQELECLHDILYTLLRESKNPWVVKEE
jgi:hypothetical protein